MANANSYVLKYEKHYVTGQMTGQVMQCCVGHANQFQHDHIEDLMTNQTQVFGLNQCKYVVKNLVAELRHD